MSSVRVMVKDLSSGLLVVRDGADGEGDELCELRPGENIAVLFDRIGDSEKARDAILQTFDIIKLFNGDKAVSA